MDRIMRASKGTLSVKREICIPVVEMPAAYSPHPQAGIAMRDKPSD
jgi:hypothetical protein